MKRLVILIVLSIIVLSSCSSDPKRMIMLGYPKEYYELRGPVKECIVQGYTYNKEKDEWDRGIGDANYPERYIFNSDGYLLSKQWGKQENENFPFIQRFDGNGYPIERRFIDGRRDMEMFFPYEKRIINDDPWYVNTEANIVDWYAWNKDEGEETIVVKCFIVSAFSFDEYLNNLTTIIKGDSSKKIKNTYVFIYRKDGSVEKIINNKEVFLYDEDGNLINYYSGRKREESYEIISPEKTVYKYLTNDKWSIRYITYVRDEFGNWISKETLKTYGDWSARERITREISYYE